MLGGSWPRDITTKMEGGKAGAMEFRSQASCCPGAPTHPPLNTPPSFASTILETVRVEGTLPLLLLLQLLLLLLLRLLLLLLLCSRRREGDVSEIRGAGVRALNQGVTRTGH